MSGVDGSIGPDSSKPFLCLEVLRNNGTEQQKRKLYAEVLKGARFGNALAEFKTKTAAQRTNRDWRETEQGYVVNGEKFYCTGSLFAAPHSNTGSQRCRWQSSSWLLFHVIAKDSNFDRWLDVVLANVPQAAAQWNSIMSQVDAEDVVPFDTAYSEPTISGPFAQITACLHWNQALPVPLLRKHWTVYVKPVRGLILAVERGHRWPTDTKFELDRVVADVRATEVLLKQAARSIDAAKTSSN